MNIQQLKIKRLKGIRFDGRPPIWEHYLYAKDAAKQRKVLKVVTVNHLINKEVYCLSGKDEVILLTAGVNHARKLIEVYKLQRYRQHRKGELIMSIMYSDSDKYNFIQLKGWR